MYLEGKVAQQHQTCGCGWLLPTDFAIGIPDESVDPEDVTIVVVCPLCGSNHEQTGLVHLDGDEAEDGGP